MDLKIILWSMVLFFGSGLVFREIAAATSGSPLGVRLGLQALAMALIVGCVVLVMRRKR